MNCTNLRDLFSDLFEERLDAAEGARARAHLAGCASCRADYESFCTATAALRGAAAEPTPAAYVEAVLAAVEEDARPVALPLPWLRWATHVGAAAAGALFAFLWLREDPVVPQAPVVVEPALQLQLAAGSGRLDRDGRTRELALDQQVELRAGDVLRAERVDALELAVDADGRLRLALPAFVPPPPVVVERIVERPVERVVEVPVEVIREVPVDGPGSRAIAQQLRRGAAALEDGVAALRELLARPPVAPRVEVVVPQGLARATAEPSAPTLAQDLPAVRIRRQGERLVLDTRGPLTEVVPTLIAQLDSSDPEVVELVQRRLEAIRDRPDDPLGWVEPAPATRSTSLAGRLFGGEREPAETAPDRVAQWTIWWEAQAPRRTEADGERVF